MTDAQRETGKAQETIVTLLTCPKCSTSNPVGTRYCNNCGADLSKVTPGKPGESAEAKRGFFSRLFGKSRRAA